MSVRMIQKSEVLQCEKIQSVAFTYALDTAEYEKNLDKDWGEMNPYMGFFNEDNRVTACVELPEYQMRYEGAWVPMVGIGGVASLPEHRRGGAIRQILQAALRQMLDKGVVFSTLYPFSHSYYRKFGYELCDSSLKYSLPLSALSGFRFDGKARMVLPGDSPDGFQKVFDACYSRCNLAVRREKKHWEKLLGKDPYKERTYGYLLEDSGGPCAYVVLAMELDGKGQKVANVLELAYTRPSGLADVLGMLYRLTGEYTGVKIPLPADVPLPALLGESFDLSVEIFTQHMARVVNVQKALQLKPHPPGSAYTLCVRDDCLPENDGVFSVCCNGEEVQAAKAPAGTPADLTLDVRTLSQLLLGYMSIDQALFKPDVQLRPGFDPAQLRRVFARRPIFLTEHF